MNVHDVRNRQQDHCVQELAGHVEKVYECRLRVRKDLAKISELLAVRDEHCIAIRTQPFAEVRVASSGCPAAS